MPYIIWKGLSAIGTNHNWYGRHQSRARKRNKHYHAFVMTTTPSITTRQSQAEHDHLQPHDLHHRTAAILTISQEPQANPWQFSWYVEMNSIPRHQYISNTSITRISFVRSNYDGNEIITLTTSSIYIDSTACLSWRFVRRTLALYVFLFQYQWKPSSFLSLTENFPSTRNQLTHLYISASETLVNLSNRTT